MAGSPRRRRIALVCADFATEADDEHVEQTLARVGDAIRDRLDADFNPSSLRVVVGEPS